MKQKVKKMIEFPNDLMMQKLHEIRREIAAEHAGLTPEQKAAKTMRDVRAYLRQKGLQFRSIRDGAFRVVKLGKK